MSQVDYAQSRCHMLYDSQEEFQLHQKLPDCGISDHVPSRLGIVAQKSLHFFLMIYRLNRTVLRCYDAVLLALQFNFQLPPSYSIVVLPAS